MRVSSLRAGGSSSTASTRVGVESSASPPETIHFVFAVKLLSALGGQGIRARYCSTQGPVFSMKRKPYCRSAPFALEWIIFALPTYSSLRLVR